MTDPQADARPVVAVANRLPVQHTDDGWELSPGGLVTALRPVMSTHSGAWVGWDGGAKGMPSTLPAMHVRLVPIGLSATQIRSYYHGFANATLWPYRIENGLCLPVEIRRAAIAEMAAHIQKHDVHRWVAEQLADIASRGAKLSRRTGTGTGAGAPGDR